MTNPNTPESSGNNNGQEEFDWEKGLEKLREQRHLGRSAAVRPQVQRPAPIPRVAARQVKPVQEEAQLNAKAAERMLREYLQQWQQEHNDPLADTITAETDTTVLLQEDWLAAQTALQSARIDDSQLEGKRTVWLNPKRQSISFAEPAAGHELETGQAEDGNVFAETEETLEAGEWLPVTVKVINPQVDPRKPVMCLSEQELLERLTRRLRPHLTDAVAGMVRVAVQKQTAALTYQLQQILSEQAPALVEEILDYNLKAAMSEIKYSLKYKR
ncbi:MULTISPECIES: hypothetical protein [unclassified Neisseria]|uniref:hypothetical protein n=1 Tax=unclassified Neisseria TaxID=2623750 RepID=UPI0010717F8B|nr:MULTISPECIES: hypothetical protein [unclassified Neisseria]MBF0804775.1 hypothetical protein [Neisseria sp. 19428wB4_WF04]TFU39527.1 hypothetical protein E4T99_10645 [Neisseria sp. WF04]